MAVNKNKDRILPKKVKVLKDNWWKRIDRKSLEKASVNREIDGICDLIFAKRLLDFCEVFPAEDPDVGYARAVTRVVEMMYTATKLMDVRGLADIRPDIECRLTIYGTIVWGASLTMGNSESSRTRVRWIRFNSNLATICLGETDLTLRFGIDMEKLYARFLEENPDPPGEGVEWKIDVDPASLSYYEPIPKPLNDSWADLLDEDFQWRVDDEMVFEGDATKISEVRKDD